VGGFCIKWLFHKAKRNLCRGKDACPILWKRGEPLNKRGKKTAGKWKKRDRSERSVYVKKILMNSDGAAVQRSMIYPGGYRQLARLNGRYP